MRIKAKMSSEDSGGEMVVLRDTRNIAYGLVHIEMFCEGFSTTGPLAKRLRAGEEVELMLMPTSIPVGTDTPHGRIDSVS